VVIVIGGMIGLGKTTVAGIVAHHFKSEVFYESVEDNPLLQFFYSATEEESASHRYPFLLQLHFLNTRFSAIKRAMADNHNVLDRSIYEDVYFATTNMELGRISPLEMGVYLSLFHNMMEEIESLPKKAPDLMIYLRGSFETVMQRIQTRGRSFELDKTLEDYYRVLWEGYDDWVNHRYSASKVLTVDMDKVDLEHNENERQAFLRDVEVLLDGRSKAPSL
jgi:deoxyadenosine/deoxycytidine kinase